MGILDSQRDCSLFGNNIMRALRHCISVFLRVKGILLVYWYITFLIYHVRTQYKQWSENINSSMQPYVIKIESCVCIECMCLLCFYREKRIYTCSNTNVNISKFGRRELKLWNHNVLVQSELKYIKITVKPKGSR